MATLTCLIHKHTRLVFIEPIQTKEMFKYKTFIKVSPRLQISRLLMHDYFAKQSKKLLISPSYDDHQICHTYTQPDQIIEIKLIYICFQFFSNIQLYLHLNTTKPMPSKENKNW